MQNIDDWIDSKISVVEAFDAMRLFLESYWNSGGRSSDDIAMLLGSLNRDEAANSYPIDMALWFDWIAQIEKATNHER